MNLPIPCSPLERLCKHQVHLAKIKKTKAKRYGIFLQREAIQRSAILWKQFVWHSDAEIDSEKSNERATNKLTAFRVPTIRYRPISSASYTGV